MYIAKSNDTPCQTWDAKMWFAIQDSPNARKAKSLCYDCPERRDCLDSAVRYERKQGEIERAIYGGLDPRERSVFLELPATVSA
jgi:hypothetical protein